MDIPRGERTTNRQAGMDVARRPKTRKRRLIFSALILIAVALTGVVTVGLARLKPAAPGVQRETVWIDSVKRGQMVREVRAVGVLIPRDVRIVAASSNGRVERILVQPGEMVSAGTVLIEMINPELEQAATDAEFQVQAAQAELANLRGRLESERMTQESEVAAVRAEYQQAKIQSDTDAALAKDGLLPALNLKLSQVKSEELASRHGIEQQRLIVKDKSAVSQVDVQKARIQQALALAKLRREQVGRLQVRAGTSGVLKEMQVEVGQQVEPGAVIAKVVEPQNLKAELHVPETQAKDIQIGQVATIDTHNGVARGVVQRIDPAVQQGTVKVDVEFKSPLPAGARPDLSVEGTIELERLNDVLYVGRPVFGQSGSTVSLFKVEEEAGGAIRVPVKLGRISVNQVEVLENLREGDRVILSDTSAWDAFNRIELK